MRHAEIEIDVLKRCLSGSTESFEVIVGRYQSLVCGMTFASTGNLGKSEELAQETFILAWKNLRQLRDLSKFKSWLCQIVRNVVQNWRRSAQRDVMEHAVSLEHASVSSPSQAQPVERVIQEEEQAVMNQAIDAMPEKYRLALILFYREDKSSREVAQLVDLSENATRQRIARARAMLKDQVAAMVETSLAQTKPGKAFTGAVVAAIAGVTMKGTAVAVATGAGGWTLSSGFSGLTVKITAVAAGLAILAGVTYTLNAQKSSGSIEASAQHSMAVVEPNSASGVVGQLAVQPSLEGDRDIDAAVSVPPLTPDPPDPNSLAFSAPQTEINPSPIVDETEESIRLRCIDEAGSPVSGALVYVYQVFRQGPPLVWGIDRNPSFQRDGPLTSDVNGFIEFEAFEGPDGQDVYRRGYGVLPYQFVGVWSQTVGADSARTKRDFTLVLHESKTVSGQISIPAGYTIESVYVDTMTVGVPAKDRPYGNSFSSFEWGDVDVFPGLFDVAVDEAGRFEVSDLPTDGRFTVRARAPGLGEEQMHVTDAQRVDIIELSLSPHGVIQGSVRFADNHAPAANRTVFCRSYSNRGIARSHVGVTDNFGYYRIEDLSEGTYEVLVGMDAFPPSHVARARNDVEVEPGLTTDYVDFELETGVVIFGTIANRETGALIEGVQVAALSPGERGGVCINTAFSDKEGRYSLRLPLGDSMLYMGQVPKGTLYPKEQGRRVVSVVSAAEPLDPVDFALGSDTTNYDAIGTGTVSGRAFDQDGTPISNALITEGRKYKHGAHARQIGGHRLARTDKEGRFSVQVQAMGEHEISIGGYEWSVHRSEWFQIERDEMKDLGDVHLVLNVLRMSVQILDEEGHPVPDLTCLVNAEGYYNPDDESSSDSEGMVFLERLPESEISILIARDGILHRAWKGFPEEHVEIVFEKD